MKIGIDIDDTVMNTLEVIDAAALYYDKVYVNNAGIRNNDTYDLKERFYWNSDIKRDFFRFFRDNQLYLKATPKGDALYYLDKLYESGYEIYFLTRRSAEGPFDILKITKNDLTKKGFKYQDCYINLSKKGAKCQELGIDIFIDDSVEQIKDVNTYGIKTILIDTWYNKYYEGLRAKNFQEVYKIIKGE